jgi:hypothetical protein
MLFKFGMADCKSILTPLDRTIKHRPDSGKVCDPTRFRRIIGNLVYLTITRPDLSYSIGVISQYMARPTEEHLQSALRILRYVSGTKDQGLLYRTVTAVQLANFTDADWAGNAADHRSTSGYAFSLGSAAVASSSKKQPTVALSSTEADYRGAVVATCEAIWLKRLLKELHEEVSDPTVIYCDNLSSIQLAKNPIFHAQTKHIEVHYHYVREHVLSSEVELQYVRTDRQIADIFTKPLGLDKLRQFSGALGLRHLDVPNLRGRGEPRPNELEIANSDSQSRNSNDSDNESRSERAEPNHRFDSDTLNQSRPKRTRRMQRKHQRHDSKEAKKGQVSEQSRPEGSMLRGNPTQPEFRKILERRAVGVLKCRNTEQSEY